MQFSDVGSSVLVLAKDTVHAPLGAATSNQTDGVVESFAEVQSAQTQANVHEPYVTMGFALAHVSIQAYSCTGVRFRTPQRASARACVPACVLA